VQAEIRCEISAIISAGTDGGIPIHALPQKFDLVCSLLWNIVSHKLFQLKSVLCMSKSIITRACNWRRGATAGIWQLARDSTDRHQVESLSFCCRWSAPRYYARLWFRKQSAFLLWTKYVLRACVSPWYCACRSLAMCNFCDVLSAACTVVLLV